MIFFLRKIRKALLSKNKLTTYLVYAIGEIVLVVIGILIALSLDNWSSEQKEANQQIKYYQDILIDLKKDSLHIESSISHFKGNLIEFYRINDQIENFSKNSNEPFYELMMYHVAFFPVTQDNHQSTIDNLSDDRIRDLLNDYFQVLARAHLAIDAFNNTVVYDSRPYFGIARDRNAIFHQDTLGFLLQGRIYDKTKMKELIQEDEGILILTELRIASGLALRDPNNLRRKNHQLTKILQKESMSQD